jgi:uracil-DNA glycosylase
MIHSPSMRSLAVLNQSITECRQCPRLVAYREGIARMKRKQYHDWIYWGRPVPAFGDSSGRLFIIGLAPAAHGGNRTGRIFTGDRSGDWLYEALHRYGFANQPRSIHKDDGLALNDCYIAAAVRCAPPDNKPTPSEFDCCRPYLVEELRRLKNVRVVLALGKIAFDQHLKACRELGHDLPSPALRFGHGVVYRLPWDITLIGSYHPSQQNTFTGRLTPAMFHGVFAQAVRVMANSSDGLKAKEGAGARLSHRRRPPLKAISSDVGRSNRRETS